MSNFTRTVLGSLVTLSLAACGGDSDKPTTDAAPADLGVVDVGEDGAQPDTALDDTEEPTDTTDLTDTAQPDDLSEPEEVVTPACSANDREACLYRPATTYTVESRVISGLTYTDIIGGERSVNIAIYRPTGAPTPLPVVLLSHGGATGKTDPMKSMDDWAPTIAGAGYLAVAIAHPGRTEETYTALCAELETNPLHQCTVKLSWDRPNDVRRVIAYLKEQALTPAFEGLVDLDRIAHVGHSAGASAAMVSLGATRNFECALSYGDTDPDQDCKVENLVSQAIDDIDVAIALSPQGPGTEGFMDESYATITKPMLMETGANDGDTGEPAVRQSIFPLLPQGNKFKMFVDDQGAKHTLFEGSTSACEPLVGLNKCEGMRSAIYATGLAFLDAYLKDNTAARSWLASDDIVKAGQGLFTFERR